MKHLLLMKVDQEKTYIEHHLTGGKLFVLTYKIYV